MKPATPCFKTLFCTLLGAVLAQPPAQAAAVHLADIVSAPTITIDFESGPETLAAPLWLESGIVVSQVTAGDDMSDIWLASGLGNGQRSWYPDGGDDGWTRITRLDGNRFDAVALFGGSGWLDPDGQQQIWFELRDNGALVLQGAFDTTFQGQSFSFSGADFDQIDLRAYRGPLSGLDLCTPVPNVRCNAFWFDDLQLGTPDRIDVPEPGAMLLGLIGLAALRARAGCNTRHPATATL